MNLPQYAPLEERLGESSCILPADGIRRNVKSACRRRLPGLQWIPRHDGTFVVCAGGPSLRRELLAIRHHVSRGDTIVAINATSEFLFERGIIPTLCVLLDPQPLLADQFLADPAIEYLVASQCHPVVFDKLRDAGCNVYLWHSDSDNARLVRRYERDPIFLPPRGSTAALKCFDLGYILGYRDIQFYGLDSSFEAAENGDLRHHAYAQAVDDGPEIIEIKVKGADHERSFITRVDYVHQAKEFIDIHNVYARQSEARQIEPTSIAVHGDGLIPYLWKKGIFNGGHDFLQG